MILRDHDCELEFTASWGKQKFVICKKQPPNTQDKNCIIPSLSKIQLS